MDTHGVLHSVESRPLEFSYLADAIILLRYFEGRGEIRRAISVVKKRTGVHERAIRELLIQPEGIQVGESLREFQGVLTGTPHFVGESRTLLKT